jgi:arylformamidase
MSGYGERKTILHDLSPAVGTDSEVWPGDSSFELQWSSSLEEGAAANVARISLSPHTGSHADAPLHLEAGGDDAAQLSLERFCGPARVIDWQDRGAIAVEGLSELPWGGVERALFRTRADGERFRYDKGMGHFLPDAARFLVEMGIRLVGIDTVSVDEFTSEDLPAHRILLSAGVAILESLEMSRVAAGDYELIALPLKLRGVDASPVRAVLRRLD